MNVVVAKDLAGKYFKAEGENADFAAWTPEEKIIPWKVIAEFKGRQLENIRYEQLLPFAQPEEGDPSAFCWATSLPPKTVPVSCIPRPLLVRTTTA